MIPWMANALRREGIILPYTDTLAEEDRYPLTLELVNEVMGKLSDLSGVEEWMRRIQIKLQEKINV